MRRILAALVTLLAVGAFATLFAISFQQMPKEQTVFIQNASDVEKSLTEEEKLRIGLRQPRPVVVIVREKNDDGFISDQGQRFLYQDIREINKGAPPFKQGTGCCYGREMQKIVIPGTTVTVWMKGPPPVMGTIKNKGTDNVTMEDGQIVAYRDVTYVTRDIWLIERVGRALIFSPLLLMWVFIDMMSVILGP